MYEVKIEGFKTKKAAETFIRWYEGGGEQYLHEVWEDCGGEGKSPMTIMDDFPFIKENGNTLTIQVRN